MFSPWHPRANLVLSWLEMVEEQKTSPADAPAPDESKADVSVADAPSAESGALVPASDADALTPEDIAAHAADADAIRAALDHIAKSRWVIARRLNDVKKRLGHGKFFLWLEHEKLGRCARQVRIDMQIMREFKSESDSDLNLIGVTALKAISGPTIPPG
jgi:hypothetical protein